MFSYDLKHGTIVSSCLQSGTILTLSDTRNRNMADSESDEALKQRIYSAMAKLDQQKADLDALDDWVRYQHRAMPV